MVEKRPLAGRLIGPAPDEIVPAAPRSMPDRIRREVNRRGALADKQKGNPARATPEGLRAWGRDYDGSPIVEGAEPMPGFTVGHLYDAAARIEELEEATAGLLDALRKARAFIVYDGKEFMANPLAEIDAAIKQAGG